MLSQSLVALSVLPAFGAAETVLGVYMFHRHGDRTSKSTPPANLTALGYQEVYTSGNYYRNRYVASDADFKINGMNSDIVKQSQITVSAPDDTVLQNSAIGFLQGLYPPVGGLMGSQTLANGTNITAPLNGYQLIPIEQVETGSGSEDNSWLQSAQSCAAASTSSNQYFSSKEYNDLLASTQSFYTDVSPVVNSTFTEAQTSFKNAYTIYDYINVATIHNSSIPSDDLLTTDRLHQLRTLADAHEWGLAYNESNKMRAVAGMVLAGEIVEFLNHTISSSGKSKMGIQFGAYATFASFFGLASLPAANADFYGVSDYASVMTFELVTNATVSSSAAAAYPSADDISVRFLFHNGTTSASSPPVAYPLFGTQSTEIAWSDFVSNMNKFSISNTEQWCNACQNTTGSCAAYAGSSSDSASGNIAAEEKSGNGLSPAVNGVIGAMVTLAVVLGIEALVLLAGGMRVVSKKRLAQGVASESVQPKSA